MTVVVGRRLVGGATEKWGSDRESTPRYGPIGRGTQPSGPRSETARSGPDVGGGGGSSTDDGDTEEHLQTSCQSVYGTVWGVSRNGSRKRSTLFEGGGAAIVAIVGVVVRGVSRWIVSVASISIACGEPSLPGESGSGSGGSGSEGTTGTTGEEESVGDSSGEPMDDSCFALEWEWVQPEPSHGLAIARDEGVAILDVEEVGGTTRLVGLSLDGSVAFDPVVVGQQAGGGLDASPDGEWWVIARDTDTQWWLRRWSTTGDALGEAMVEVFPGGAGVAYDLAVPPDGGAMIGGTVDDLAFGRAELMRVADDGTALWEQLGSGNVTSRVLIDPAGTVYGMVSGVQVEGADTYLEAYDADGTPRWSQLIGSHGGFGDEHQSPFALDLDGEGGFVALGSERVSGGGPMFLGRVERLDSQGLPVWVADFELPVEGSFAHSGDVTRVGDLAYVAVAVGSRSTLLRTELDGTPRCIRQLGPEHLLHSLVAVDDEAVIGVGSVVVDGVSTTRVARYRVVVP